ncbi:YhcH/YjgK/YiaL family protein [Paraclostridium bifermentans]|uniref:YhcH/YjgK/YiaL family protein n=1 Tax=Paraclostridium bifermentans TaxID=1490 RepID=UPI00242D1745|nr:YhcH/YjgK/YiaL family protein [Paraclostridium bifermentans]
MLVENIRLSEKYDYLRDEFKKAYEFLKRDDLNELSVGSIRIGEKVTAYVQEYITSDRDDLDFETHEKNIDIQYMISGQEIIEVCNRKLLEEKTSYDTEKDIQYYKEPKERFTSLVLNPGDIAILMIEDAHKPRCRAINKQTIKKIVIKIAI